MDPDQLRAALVAVPDRDWLCGALLRVVEEPRTIAGLYAVAGRRCGHLALPAAPGWTADVAARVLLLTVLPMRGRELAGAIGPLYQFGDGRERLAVLRALPLLEIGGCALPLLREAVDGKDPILLGAAMGPYSAHLDDVTWREAVLRCVHTGVPVALIHDVEGRGERVLACMLAEYISERRSTGAHVRTDAVALLRRLTADEMLPALAEGAAWA
ncbi:EboA domain-containing protein [Longispora urticae]